jgi:hypothetical protein
VIVGAVASNCEERDESVRRTYSLVTALALLLLLVTSTVAQHDVDGREQWQPQRMTDARLNQPVELEILGRSASAALDVLSEETGVLITVAPEDIETVGERKLIVIAQGLDLKSIMVQIPNALRECHWDVDVSGEHPVYLLHRNAGAVAMVSDGAWKGMGEWANARRDARLARIEEASYALNLSSRELAELERTDLVLARALLDPDVRARAEALFSLPDEHVQEFVEIGVAPEREYEDAGPQLQQVARATAERNVEWYSRAVERLDPNDTSPDAQLRRQSLEDARYLLGHLSEARLSYVDGGMDRGVGVWFSITGPPRDDTDDGVPRSAGDVAIPARHPHPLPRFRDLLMRTGTENEETARRQLDALWAARSTDSVHRIWNAMEGSRLSRLLHPFDVTGLESIEMLQLAQMVAHQTPLSVITDYFWRYRFNVTNEMRGEHLLRRVLGHLSLQGLEATAAGNCLVLHNKLWYVHSPLQLPESIALVYRALLEERGGFTLDEVAELAVQLRGQRDDQMGYLFPVDLHDAGVGAAGMTNKQWALLLYASLSVGQRATLRGEYGLSVRDLSPAQCRQLIDEVGVSGSSAADDDIAGGTIRLATSATSTEGRPATQFEFTLQLPGESDSFTRARFTVQDPRS